MTNICLLGAGAGFRNYEASRQFADARAVSRLSPFLHFGQLSPRLVIAEARKRGGMAMSKTFMRRLVWRDLAYWQLHHWPTMPLHPIRKHYSGQVRRQSPTSHVESETTRS
jgi:deoxyribodipyrimidine photolyase